MEMGAHYDYVIVDSAPVLPVLGFSSGNRSALQRPVTHPDVIVSPSHLTLMPAA